MILEKVKEKIKECEESFLQIGLVSQKFIQDHDLYLEQDEKIKDSKFIKNKIKEKIARVMDE